MRLDAFEIYHLQIPFRRSFAHSKAVRHVSDSVLVKCTLADATTGWGESLPRPYVTGETVETVVDNLESRFIPTLEDLDPCDFEQVVSRCSNLYEQLRERFPEAGRYIGASVCALELALLDAFGRHFKQPCLPAGAIEQGSRYSSVISAGSPLSVALLAAWSRLWGFSAVKVKVGVSARDDQVRLVRRIVGPRVSLRVDANGAWSADECIAWLERHGPEGVVAVEQPVGADDLEGLKCLTKRKLAEIITDESIRDLDDARRLSAERACDGFNVRISKCGGLFQSLKIARLARDEGMGVQLGCQVGETSLLSAAGLHLLGQLSKLRFIEGCFGTFLLKQDIVSRPLKFGFGGRPPGIPGRFGLGVEVQEDRVRQHARLVARL